jgi:hypothetical protein
MEFIKKFQAYINNLDETRFYQYMLGFLISIGLITASLMFNYYRTTSKLKRELNALNETRDEVRILLDKAQHVKKEQKEVDEIIAQDPNFKIAGYFEDVLTNLNLQDKKDKNLEVTSPAQEGRYQESVLNARFSAMTMQQLTELLKTIDQNKRIFTKELEITASNKTPNTIDVSLTIATLEPQTQNIE